jgi:ElaA protein
MMMDWQWQTFSQLSGQDLYSVLAARQQVFLLEQQCIYPDMDGQDQDAHHLLGWRTIGDKPQIVAYLRCLAPGAKYAEMSIGRVLTTANNRGAGLGRELLVEGIAHAARQHPGHRIRIGAQLYLEHFYTDLGFQSTSDPYDDDGIMHIDMLR